jgi:hypothetical protein
MRISADSAEKKKRGRPPVVPENLRKIYNYGNASQSRRTVLDRHYGIIAFQAIMTDGEVDPAFHWLVDPNHQAPNDTVYRRSIMYELGRIEDPDDLLSVARRICELKPKTRDAIAMIRRFRRGETPVHPGALAAELIRAVNAYKTRHPSTSWETIRSEVETAWSSVDRMVTQA